MNKIFLTFSSLIIILFISCLDDSSSTELSILGTWNVNKMDNYESADCTGDSTDGMGMGELGSITMTWEFTNDNIFWESNAEFSDTLLCALAFGIIENDTCLIFGGLSELPIDSLCNFWQGSLSNGLCNTTSLITMEYELLDNNQMQLTTNAGTDSSSSRIGTYQLFNTNLTISMVDTSIMADSSKCKLLN